MINDLYDYDETTTAYVPKPASGIEAFFLNHSYQVGNWSAAGLLFGLLAIILITGYALVQKLVG